MKIIFGVRPHKTPQWESGCCITCPGDQGSEEA